MSAPVTLRRMDESRMPITDLGAILSIWAHPDDETYLAAGVMADARDLDQRVVCASPTAGDTGPTTGPRGRGRLAAVRRWEAAAAMAILGVDEHHVGGLPDGDLAEQWREGYGLIRASRTAWGRWKLTNRPAVTT